jgi:hypothetical protein
MNINQHNYKRHDLFVDTNIQNTIIPFQNDNTNVNANINENRNNIQNNIQNNYTFKDFIIRKIKMQTMSDTAIKINIIALVFVLNLPQVFFDLYYKSNVNILSKNYLLVSIVQKQTFSFIFVYYIVTEDLIKLFQFPNGNKLMTMLCKIDTYWCKYYSILGIIIVIYNWFISRYIDETNIYILVFSILKLSFIKNITKMD